MDQTRELTDALKRALRVRGLRYRDVATALGISEASVKRTFSEGSFTLKRVEEICRLMDMTIYELARLTRMAQERAATELSAEQEQALADQESLLRYFYLLINGWTPASINQEYGIDEIESTLLLTRLDGLNLIELLPGNAVRLRTGRNIAWRPNGSLRERYSETIRAEFLTNDFTGEDTYFYIEAGELSDASRKMLLRRIKQLVKEFNDLADFDTSLQPSERRGMGFLLAMRPWVFSMIRAAPEAES